MGTERPRWIVGAALLALGLSGCMATARLSERRSAYQAELAGVAAAEAGYARRADLLQGALERSRTPLAGPYPALVDRLRALKGDLDGLAGPLSSGRALVRDFDAFAAAEPPVVTGRSRAWPEYRALDRRFGSVAAGLDSGRRAFDADAAAFDSLARSAPIVHLAPADLRAALDALAAELNGGLRRMENRTRLDRDQVRFEEGSNEDPALLAVQRDTLETMQEHLFKTGDLVRRAMQLSDALRTADAGGDGLWAGPGLPDDGSSWARLGRMREAFRRRRAEFRSLSQTFASLQTSAPGAQ